MLDRRLSRTASALAILAGSLATGGPASAQPSPPASAQPSPPAGTTRKVIATGAGEAGASALDVQIDAANATVRVRRCKSADCTDTATTTKVFPIGLDRSRIDLARSTIEPVAVARDRRVVRVRIPDPQRGDLAFELVVGGHSDEPIFAGLTGYTRGEEGDRSGNAVLVSDRDAESKYLVVAETREDTRICGQATTPLAPRGLDPATMQLRGATLHRIEKKTRDAAQRVIAQALPTPPAPLARMLVATGGSAPQAAALTDGKLDTAWSEQRPGDGHGEFATLRSPGEVPIEALVVHVAPTASASAKPRPEGTAPRTFYVATDDHLFHVTMPEDAWRKPGQAYEVPLSPAVRTTCVAIVLDEAYARSAGAPEVTLTEVLALSRFDREGATLDDVTKALSTPRGDEAAALLKRGGDASLAAVARQFATLDPRGRALAVDVASSAGTCTGPAAELLTLALADREVEVRKRAMGRLERCGKNAAEALAIAVRSPDEARRAAAAPMLATVAPSLALEPLAEQMGKGSPETRRAVRGAFARAAAGATRDKLLNLLVRRDLDVPVRLDLLRATGPKLPELRPEADAAIAELLRGAPDMPTRWLLAQPLAHLARAPDATSGELTRLADLVLRDPEWAVRARAVELAAGIGPLAPAVVTAASDAEPRVREAALRAIASSSHAPGAPAAARALASDPWTFVRVAAADALGAVRPDTATAGALASGLGDASPRVRSSVILAIGKQRSMTQAGRVRERLEDAHEDPEVRALAARTLGTLCVQSATDKLTKLAHLSRSPVDEADERVGMAAIEALGALHPSDLESRLAPLRAKDVSLPVRRAAERALSEPSACR